MFRKILIVIATAAALTFSLGAPANAGSTKYSTPKGIYVQAGGAHHGVINGSPVKNAQHYTIKYSTSKKMTNAKSVRYDVYGPDDYYMVVLEGLKNSTTYYVTVEVSDANGKRLSKASSVKSFKTKKADPIHDPRDDDDGDN